MNNSLTKPSWLQRHLGILIVDWSVSVWWVTAPAGPETETPIGNFAYPAEKSIGFTFGLCFLSLDRNDDSVGMLSLFGVNGVRSDFDWSWGAARILPEGSDLDDGDTAEVYLDSILVKQPDGSFVPALRCEAANDELYQDTSPTLPYLRGQDDVLTALMEEGVPCAEGEAMIGAAIAEALNDKR